MYTFEALPVLTASEMTGVPDESSGMSQTKVTACEVMLQSSHGQWDDRNVRWHRSALSELLVMRKYFDKVRNSPTPP